MHTTALGAALFVLAFLLGSSAHAQKATERYIPIGKSPGLSQIYTVVGEIAAVDVRTRTLTVSTSAGARTVEISDRTRIWLDRTGLEGINSAGAIEHCKPGRTVEVHYGKGEAAQQAEWVKIRVDR